MIGRVSPRSTKASINATQPIEPTNQNWRYWYYKTNLLPDTITIMVIQTSLLPFDVPIDRQSEEPIYQQLIEHFQIQIANGRLQPGTRLPPSRDLARELGIGRISVVSAYNELQVRGLVSAHPGRGTFVAGAENGRKTISQPHLNRQQAIPHQ